MAAARSSSRESSPTRGCARSARPCDATVWEDELPPPRDALLRSIEGCDGVLTLLTDKVDDEFLDRAGPQLKVVSNFAVGFDNIDVAGVHRARASPSATRPGVLTETTADLAWALLMAAARRVTEGDRYVRAGNWKTWGPMLLMGPDVHGATLGVVGFGRIGQAVARRAQGFGMRIVYHDLAQASPAVEAELGATYMPLEELLPRRRLRLAARQPQPADAGPAQRRAAALDEADARSSSTPRAVRSSTRWRSSLRCATA